jgi:hypothetical protein
MPAKFKAINVEGQTIEVITRIADSYETLRANEDYRNMKDEDVLAVAEDRYYTYLANEKVQRMKRAVYARKGVS